MREILYRNYAQCQGARKLILDFHRSLLENLKIVQNHENLRESVIFWKINASCAKTNTQK